MNGLFKKAGSKLYIASKTLDQNKIKGKKRKQHISYIAYLNNYYPKESTTVIVRSIKLWNFQTFAEI